MYWQITYPQSQRLELKKKKDFNLTMSQLLFAKMSDNYRFACIEYRVLGI